MKIHAYCFYQPESFLQMMQDSVDIRMKDLEQVQALKAQDTLDFIEALSVSNQENRVMSSHLAKILRKTTHLQDHQDVPLFALSYLADFNLKITDGLHAQMLTGLQQHLGSYSVKELSHMAVSLMTQSNFTKNKCLFDQVIKRVQELGLTEADQATLERLALASPLFKLDHAST